MGLLFKTALIHLKKNSFATGVLSFFVVSGAAVMSSSHLLTSNLNKGYQEINYDSNPHDLILLSKSSKPSQKIPVNVKYDITDIQDLEVRRSLRWSWDSLKNDFWAKSDEYEQVMEDILSDKAPKSINSQTESKFKSLPTINFSIPRTSTNNYSWSNAVLMCSSSTSFFSNADAEMEWIDRNESLFNLKEEYTGRAKDSSFIRKSCHNRGSGSSNTRISGSLNEFFNSLYKYHRDHTSKDSTASFTKEEVADIHRQTDALNPRYFWKGKLFDSTVYMPLLEEDYYISLSIPFRALLKDTDIAEHFLTLASNIRNSEVYYYLGEDTRIQIEKFLSNQNFRRLPLVFTISSIAQYFHSNSTLLLPMVPGMTYRETLFMFLKMIMWDHLQNSQSFLSLYSIKNPTLDDQTKNSFLKAIDKWDESIKGISDWNPFSEVKETTITSQEQYVFSTLRPDITLGELKKTPGGVNDSSNSFYSSKDNQTLIKTFKDALKSWINNESIPSFSRDSKVHAQATPFSEAYSQTVQLIQQSITNYLDSSNVLNTNVMRKFLNESEIFSLSFLMQSFVYDPHKYLGHSQPPKSKNEEESTFPKDIDLTSSPNPPKNNRDYFPSINYHKSLVVTNSGNTSAKLNDPTKTWHSFKVVSRDRKDNSYVNTIKILSGNPLFNVHQDFLSTFMGYKSHSRNMDFYNTLRRMKHTNIEFAKDAQKRYDYLSYPYDDPWKAQKWTKPPHPHTGQSWKDYDLPWSTVSNSQGHSGLSAQGARISLLLQDAELLHLTRTFKVISYYLGLPAPSYIDQSSAFFTVVSPFYAQQNNITPISDAQYAHFKKLVEGNLSTQEDWEREYSYFVMHPDNHNHIVNVNGNKLIVVGTGLSPDMILPSHAPLNLIPNKEREAILYVDKYGYNNIKFNSLSTWDEQYLSISYPQAVKDMGLEEDYRNQMSEYIRSYLVSRGAGTTEDQFQLTSARTSNPFSGLNLVFLRTQYADHLIRVTNLLFNIIFAFMFAVILFTVWMLIKQYISSYIKTFGVFVANGIHRLKIIFNSSLFILIPSVIGVTIGYLISLPLQPTIFGLVSSVWYLSPIFSGFSAPTWLFYVLVTCSVLGPISWITSFFLMRKNVSNLMRVNPTFKQNKLVQFMSHNFHHLSSLWKFRLSIITNTAGRGLLLSSVASLMFIFTSFLFNNLNQFKHVSDMEIQTKDYGYSLLFNTPSEQSGQPHLTSYTNMGDTIVDGTPHTSSALIHHSDTSTWTQDSIQFGPDKPEIIGSGINFLYDHKDIKDYMSQCSNKNLTLDQWNQKLGFIDLDYPSKSTDDQIYNHFLFAKQLTKKSNHTFNCFTPIDQNFDIKDREFIRHTKEQDSLWFKSRNNSNQQSDFNPSTDVSNQIGVLGQYVPVKNEDRINKSSLQMEKYGDEPLFKPLIDHYSSREPLLKNHLFSNKDFIDFNNQAKHPTLSRLYRDHSNYWLLLYHDYNNLKTTPTFFKNRIILPILFNHTWSVPVSGKIIDLNPWNDFKEFLSRYSTELVSALETNHFNFINEILKSRYGAYFISRFMSRHATAQENLSHDHQPGKVFWNKPTWKVTKDLLAEHNKNSIEDGLYWINPDKILYFHDIMGVNRFFIFRPDFLYLFYSLMKDPTFLTKAIAPIKVAFNQNIYTPDYSKPFGEWSSTGDWKKDDESQLGLTASSQNPNYESIPNGDQSYTYLRVSLPSTPNQQMDIFGIKQDPRGSYIKLRDQNQIINHLLYQSKSSSGEYPIIVNQFTAKRMDLQKGSTFKVLVHNTHDRFTRQANNKSPKIVTFKVVAIYDSYFQNSFYLSQKNANEILGLNPEYGYNGIYTKQFDNNDLPMQLSKAISGFSAPGIYSFVKMDKTSDAFFRFLKHTSIPSYDNPFTQPANYRYILNRLGVTDSSMDHEQTANLLVQLYGSSSALSPSVIKVDPAGFTNNFMFRAVPELIMSVINLFIIVFTPLLVLSLIVITKLIIEDLRNILTILNLLGFTYSENSTTILLYLGLVLSLATIIALPLSSALISFYSTGIFNTLSIYLPIGLRADYAFLSFTVLLSMFSFSYWISLRKIKSLYLPNEMKALVV